MQPSGKQPDYDLVILRKSDQKKGKIGAAWKNEDGSISIVLNPLVQVTETSDLNIRLFTRTPYQGRQQDLPIPPAGKYKDQSAIRPKNQDSDDVPF